MGFSFQIASQTGHPLPPAERGAARVGASDKDWPAFGSVVSYLDKHSAQKSPHQFPPYVYLPKLLGHFAGYDINGQFAGWLGKAYNPMSTNIQKRDAGDNPYFRDCNDEELDFRLAGLDPLPEMTIDRLNTRQSLLAQLDFERRRLDQSAAAQLRHSAQPSHESADIGQHCSDF